MTKQITYIILSSIIALTFTFAALPSNSKDTDNDKILWERHKSITKAFNVKFPQKYKYKIFPFQFNDSTIAYSETLIGSLDDGAEENKNKQAIIKVIQTFGSPLTVEDSKKILKDAADKYKEYAKDINGTLLTNIDINYKKFSGKELYIKYTENDKAMGMRIRVYTTNYTKIEQILNGSESVLYSYNSNTFFDSLNLFDGRVNTNTPIGVGWVEYPSKNNIFTAVLPPMNSDYTPLKPKSSATVYTEKMNFLITDPLFGDDVKYNIYSYKGVSNFTKEKAKSILFSNHVSRFVRNASLNRLKTESKIGKRYNTLETNLVIRPTKKYPKTYSVFFRAVYKGKVLVVQEVLYGRKYTKSRLHETLFPLLKFHPEKYSHTKK